MKSKVRINKGALDYFRKRSIKNFPYEIQSFFIGEVINPELIDIKEICHVNRYAVQSTNSVQWYLEDFNKIKNKAEEQGFRIVGDIHSHPSWDAVLSPTDYRTHIESGHRVSAICSVNDNKTRVRFWIAESCLPLVVEYV